MPEEPLNVFDFEAIARQALLREAYDYYAGGAQDEVTLRENRAAYDRLSLAYRVLVDVSRRDLTASVLGQPVAMPILVAPTAFHRLATLEGELATARAAGAAGTVMILSTLSTTPIEAGCQPTGRPNGPGERSPGLRPQADALGKQA